MRFALYLATFRFGRPDLDLANYRSFWHLQQHAHHAGYVLGMNFPPVCAITGGFLA
jgi:hypothetical protein